jgi:D-3-phosphoglycerate dehydrogenase
MKDLEGFRVAIIEPMDGQEGTYTEFAERGAEVVLGPPVSRFDLKMTEDRVIEMCKDADAILAMTRDPITPYVLDHCPRLRIISKYGRGIDHLPLDAAAERGILITNTPVSHSSTVAEFTFALIIICMRKMKIYHDRLQNGLWRDTSVGGREMKGKTIGIFGYGAIGKALVRRLQGWEMEVLVYDPIAKKEEVEAAGAKLADPETILRNSDVVTVHVPLISSTRGMFGRKEFEMMKEGAVFINVSRGALVDEAALIDALNSGHLSAAGLDVHAVEPVPADNVLLHMPNVFCTPHEAGTTKESSCRISEQGTENAIRALLGEVPAYVVNPDGIEKWKTRFVK